MQTQTYRVIYPLVHDNVRSEPESVVELSDEDAFQPLADGVVDGPVAPVETGEPAPSGPRAGKAK